MSLVESPNFKRSAVIAFASAGFLALVHLIFWFFDINKEPFMMYPQEQRGLVGIVTSQLLHADYEHLFTNCCSLVMFMMGIYSFYPKVALRAIIGMWLLTGLWVWILVPQTGIPILGSSGVIYGLAGFLFFSGIFRRDYLSIIISAIMGIVYGGMLVGLFPTEKHISWQSHLLGFLAGMVIAFFYRKVDAVQHKRKRYAWEDEPENDPRDESADWNYQKNWPGSQTLYTPGDSEPNEQS